MKNYNRVIDLQCPICGGIDFLIEDENKEVVQATCSSCDKVLSREELMDSNSQNIETHIDEVKEDIINDITKSFKSIFK